MPDRSDAPELSLPPRMRAASSRQDSAKKVGQTVRRDVLILCGFIAAGSLLSINFDVLGELNALVRQHVDLPLSKVFGAIIFVAVGLTLYGFSRYHARIADLKQLLETEQRASRLAMHDQLTGLPNRRHFKAMLNWQLSEAAGARRFAVIAVNIDRFKAFNDLHGRAAGDEMLMALGRTLNLRAGVDGFVGRLDGDAFVVMTPDLADDELIGWVSALLTTLEAPVTVGDKSLSVSATAGIAIGIADGQDAETLLHRADIALRRAKEATRGWFAFFRAGMADLVLERAVFEHDLWTAVREDAVTPSYQPLVRLSDRQVCGYEILARWRHRERGDIPPDQFIPLAEASGAIDPLTMNLLRRACADAVAWGEGGHLSLNLSPTQLDDPELPERLFAILDATGFPAERLEVELTEGALVADQQAARNILTALRERGVRTALDNFGTGNSSLRQLRELPFDKLKIDRSFIARMFADEGSAAQVRAMIAMAKNLGLVVVAEGVETAEQARTLAAIGCDMAQGYFFGKPVTGKAVLAHVRSLAKPQAALPPPSASRTTDASVI